LKCPAAPRALNGSELVEVTIGTRVGVVPRPNLLGAIVLKARAVDVDDVPANQLEDLAFLLSLATSPRRLASEMTKGDRKAVRARQESCSTRVTPHGWRSKIRKPVSAPCVSSPRTD